MSLFNLQLCDSFCCPIIVASRNIEQLFPEGEVNIVE